MHVRYQCYDNLWNMVVALALAHSDHSMVDLLSLNLILASNTGARSGSAGRGQARSGRAARGVAWHGAARQG